MLDGVNKIYDNNIKLLYYSNGRSLCNCGGKITLMRTNNNIKNHQNSTFAW